MTMDGGYPTRALIEAYLADRGIEIVTESNNDFMEEYYQFLWGIINSLDFACALSVYPDSAALKTFNVRSGSYNFNGTIKTYTAGSAVDPTDNDTTYVWMAADNTISSAIDGTGWPATEHIKLAEIDVDSDGVITAVRDLRGKAFLQAAWNVLNSGGASVEALPVHWDSPSPADDDEVRIPIYANNDAAEKTEVARFVIKLTDVSDGTEDATISLSRIVAGALTSLGELVCTSSANVNGSTLQDLTSNMAVPFTLSATLTAGNTVQIYNSDAPFKFRILDAWSIAKSADAGTWKLTDGTNDVTDAVAVTATDKTIDRAGTIDDGYNEIAASGSLSVVGDGSLADVDVTILCVRVA